MTPRTPSPILAALDRESLDYLTVNAPEIVTAVEEELAAGKTPDAIYRAVIRHIGPDRAALSARIYQAACALARMQRE